MKSTTNNFDTSSQSNCPCKTISNTNQKQQITCKTCGFFQHLDCVKECVKMKNYECPACQIKISDIYVKNIQNILTPSLIKHEKTDSKYQFPFTFAKDFSTFLDNSDYNNSTNIKYLFLRCLRLDSDGYEHHWPYNCQISINNINIKALTLPKIPPRSKSRVDYPIVFCFKPDDTNQSNNYHNLHREHFYPLKYLNFNQKNIFEIKVDWSKNDNDKNSYVLSFDLVEIRRSVDEVVSNVPVINETDKLKLIIAEQNGNLGNINDLMASEKVNLIDCFTQSQRIKIPSRTYNCSHLSVFDLKYFVALNRKNKSYNCPLCKCKATRLYVDGFILKYIEEFPESNEILLSQDYIISNKNSDNINITPKNEFKNNKTNKNKNGDCSSNLKKVGAPSTFINVVDLNVEMELNNCFVPNSEGSTSTTTLPSPGGEGNNLRNIPNGQSVHPGSSIINFQQNESNLGDKKKDNQLNNINYAGENLNTKNSSNNLIINNLDLNKNSPINNKYGTTKTVKFSVAKSVENSKNEFSTINKNSLPSSELPITVNNNQKNVGGMKLNEFTTSENKKISNNNLTPSSTSDFVICENEFWATEPSPTSDNTNQNYGKIVF